MDMGKKNMAKCLADSIIRRSFVVLNITNQIRTYITRHIWRRSDLRSLCVRGVQQTFRGDVIFFVPAPKHNRNISKMLNPTNQANEAKNSTLDRTVRAPKWVGVIGFILILCAPLEGADFGRNVIFYLLFNLPVALFCFYATGALDQFINHLRTK